jgi:hypothetical protein
LRRPLGSVSDCLNSAVFEHVAEVSAAGSGTALIVAELVR